MFRNRLVLALAALALAVPQAAEGANAAPEPGVWVPTQLGWATDVDVFANGRAYAVTRDPNLLTYRASIQTSDDSGLTWRESWPSFAPWELEMANATTGYSLSRSDNTGARLFPPHLFRTTDGATTWQRRSLPYPAGLINTETRALRASPDARTVIASMELVALDANGCVDLAAGAPYFLSNDGGATWSHRALPQDGVIWHASFPTAQDGVVLLREDVEREMVYSTGGACSEWGGEWHKTSMWVTHNGGRTFTEVLDLPIGKDESAVAMTPAGRIVRFRVDRGPIGIGISDSVTVLVSDDDGRTWRATQTLLCGAHCYPRDIVFTDDRVGYVALERDVLQTADGGETWHLDLPGEVTHIAAAGPDAALAIVNDRVLTRLGT